MQIKSFTAMSNHGLDRKVNAFLEQHPKLEIIDIKFSASFGNLNAVIVYKS